MGSARVTKGKGPAEFLKRSEAKNASDRAKRGREDRLEVPSPRRRIHAELWASALVGNYRAIAEQAKAQGRDSLFLLPMIKADAYGHGAAWVARQLLGQEHLLGFGVATLEEGVALRAQLGTENRALRISVFSGCTPWDDAKADLCAAYALTAVLTREEDWRLFLSRKHFERVEYELFFNTGMNRLGIPLSLAREVSKKSQALKADERPVGIVSHLAQAEDPSSRLSQLQLSNWRALSGELKGGLSRALFHLGNSAAIWNAKHWGLHETTDVVRPGLALYGIPPWAGAPLKGLKPVMRVRAPVVQVHRLKPGESIGYGGTYTVKGTEPVSVAIIDAGYADGVHRFLGQGRGYAAWPATNQVTRFVGVVSMDLIGVHCSPTTQAGEWVEFWGPALDPWTQAQAAGTIPYEMMTGLSARVPRVEGTVSLR